jgi:exodeoxyribonuclease-3
MRIATWNVNGIRARERQLMEWLVREPPDILCLQEIKAAPEQIPESLSNLPGYWCRWHCAGPYSGVGLLVSRHLSSEQPRFEHPPFDMETRALSVRLGSLAVVSMYVPNGGKDFPAKMRFLEEVGLFLKERLDAGDQLILCGDLNVARTDMDVHPKERKAKAIGQLPEERALLERIIEAGVVDVGRALDPDNDALFTWWAPWRNLRQRNIGWRIDYILASEALAGRASLCKVLAAVGTSDHAPVVAQFEM